MRHPFHAICPYFAMFPESFPERWIEELTEPGDVVLDPFCGRGTTPFQALLMGRHAIASDINPVAYCVTRAKLRAPRPDALRRRVTVLERESRNFDAREEADALPPFFHHAYSQATLAQLLFLRGRLNWRKSDTDAMLAALVLGRLHGETRKSRNYLSNQMPRTISPKPDYSIRYWETHGDVAPERDVYAFLRDQTVFRYRSGAPEPRGDCHRADVRDLPTLGLPDAGRVRCVVTSPPYFDVTRFEEDQWLRLWFLGGPPHPTYGKISRDDRHGNPKHYWAFLSDAWAALAALLADAGHVVFRIGGTGMSAEELVEGLTHAARTCGRSVDLQGWWRTDTSGKQTHAFRPGAHGCRFEVDCHFVFH